MSDSSRSPNRRVALLVPTPIRYTVAGEGRTSVGGAEMRFESLRQALSTNWDCLYIEARCGGPGTDHTDCGFADSEAGPGSSWYYDTSYCPMFAQELVSYLNLKDVEYVICSSLNVHRYVRPLAAGLSARIIFDLHNIEANLYSEMRRSMSAGDEYDRVLSDQNAKMVAAAEASAVQHADILWVCSEEDMAALPRTYPAAVLKRTVHVPDTVNVDVEPQSIAKLTRAIFTARLDYFPNVLAAETIVEEIAPALPDLDFIVAGAQPHARLKEASWGPNVRLIADPPTVVPLFAEATMVVPLTHGGGSRFKVIEACALGSPVVSTRKGAEGLGAVADRDYLAAENAAEFVSAICRLRSDEGLRRSVTHAGWSLASTAHSTQALGAKLASLD